MLFCCLESCVCVREVVSPRVGREGGDGWLAEEVKRLGLELKRERERGLGHERTSSAGSCSCRE